MLYLVIDHTSNACIEHTHVGRVTAAIYALCVQAKTEEVTLVTAHDLTIRTLNSVFRLADLMPRAPEHCARIMTKFGVPSDAIIPRSLARVNGEPIPDTGIDAALYGVLPPKQERPQA